MDLTRSRGFLKAGKSQDYLAAASWNQFDIATAHFCLAHISLSTTQCNGILIFDYEWAWDKVQDNYGHQYCIAKPSRSRADQVLSHDLDYHKELIGKFPFLWLAVRKWLESCLWFFSASMIIYSVRETKANCGETEKQYLNRTRGTMIKHKSY